MDRIPNDQFSDNWRSMENSRLLVAYEVVIMVDKLSNIIRSVSIPDHRNHSGISGLSRSEKEDFGFRVAVEDEEFATGRGSGFDEGEDFI